MPQEQRTRRHRKQQQIRHLRGQAGCIVHGSFPYQPAQNAPDEPEIFHLRQSLLCRRQISIKLRLALASKLPPCFAAQLNFMLRTLT
jgi:hypothetical protein